MVGLLIGRRTSQHSSISGRVSAPLHALFSVQLHELKSRERHTGIRENLAYLIKASAIAKGKKKWCVRNIKECLTAALLNILHLGASLLELIEWAVTVVT